MMNDENRQAATDNPLYVQSVEKAFRVLSAFDSGRHNLGLTEIATACGLDKSAAQRFTFTLCHLGYLRKDPESKRFELTPRTLGLSYLYLRTSPLVEAARPQLLHLSRETEEAVSLTVLEDTQIVFVSRLLSRHMLNTDVIVGTRLPAYCTAPGRAILSRLPQAEVREILDRSDRRAFTQATTWKIPDILAKLEETALKGYAMACEEIYQSDISVAAAVIGPRGLPIGAVNIAVNKLRCSPEEAERRLVPLVTAAAQNLSRSPPMVNPLHRALS